MSLDFTATLKRLKLPPLLHPSVSKLIKHLFRQPAAESLTLMKSFLERIIQNIILNMGASLIWSHDCTFSPRDGGG